MIAFHHHIVASLLNTKYLPNIIHHHWSGIVVVFSGSSLRCIAARPLMKEKEYGQYLVHAAHRQKIIGFSPETST